MNARESNSPADEPATAAALPGDRAREPDVLLDVSELRVDEISLDVEDLRARVSLQPDVLQLLKLHAGVEAELGKVQLTIKGVEAKLLLQVRLNNVAQIIERVLTTIDNNPNIIEYVARPAVEAAEEAVAGAGRAVPPLLSTVSEREPAWGSPLAPSAGAPQVAGQGAAEAGAGADEDAQARPAKRSPASRARRTSTGSAAKRPAKRSRASRTRRSEED